MLRGAVAGAVLGPTDALAVVAAGVGLAEAADEEGSCTSADVLTTPAPALVRSRVTAAASVLPTAGVLHSAEYGRSIVAASSSPPRALPP